MTGSVAVALQVNLQTRCFSFHSNMQFILSRDAAEKLGPAEMLLNCSTRWSAAGAGSNIGGLNCIGGDWTNCIAGDCISCLDVKFPPGSGLYCFLGRTQEYFDKKTEKGPNIFGWVDGRFYL